MSSQFNLITNLSANECISRLNSAIDYESLDLRNLHFGRGSKQVLGKATAEGFLLRTPHVGSNSFKTYAVGNLYESVNGTLITGRFSAHPGFKLGLQVWGCSAVFLGIPFAAHLLYTLVSGEARADKLWNGSYNADIFVLGILIWTSALYGLGRFLSRGDNEVLYHFLKQTLEARPI